MITTKECSGPQWLLSAIFINLLTGNEKKLIQCKGSNIVIGLSLIKPDKVRFFLNVTQYSHHKLVSSDAANRSNVIDIFYNQTNLSS